MALRISMSNVIRSLNVVMSIWKYCAELEDGVYTCTFYFYYCLTTGLISPTEDVYLTIVKRHQEFIRLALKSLCTISNWTEYDIEARTLRRRSQDPEVFAMDTDEDSEDDIRTTTGCFDWGKDDIEYLVSLTHAIRYHNGKCDRFHSVHDCATEKIIPMYCMNNKVTVCYENIYLPYWEADMWGKISFDNGYRLANNRRRILKINSLY